MPKPKNGSGKTTSPEKRHPKQLGRKALQEIARPHGVEAIETMVKLMRDGDNDNVKLGAARSILSKVLPDLKATELTGKDGKDLILKLIQYGANTSS